MKTERAATRVVTLRENGQLTLPAELRKRVRARPGDVFLAEADGDVIVLRRKELVDASQAYFWTPEWQKMEREASADIAARRVRRAKGAEKLIARLKR